jgi:hypothetical protein
MKERRATVRPEDDRGTTRMRASGNPRAVSGTAPLQLRAFPSRRLPDHLREITRRLVGPSPTRGDCPPAASSGQARPGGRAVVPGPSTRRSSTMDVGPISDPPDRATWQCAARNAPVSGSALVVVGCSSSRVSCLQMKVNELTTRKGDCGRPERPIGEPATCSPAPSGHGTFAAARSHARVVAARSTLRSQPAAANIEA